ncbi:MAG: putative multidrug ABC transporter permease YbhS [Bryobacteraceae bacterium]|nr:putative multidrug ABC transporter permease YbhS [Bryobacteraceae bacterium]
MISLRRTRALARKELLHIARDPLSLGMALALPMLLLVLFGYALSLDVDRIPLLLYDQDRTPQSRALIARFEGSRFFQINGYIDGYASAELALDGGKAMAVLVIPHDFGGKLSNARPSPVQLLLDGSDSNTAGIALGYARAMVAGYSNEVRTLYQVRNGSGEIKPPVDTRLRVVFNSELKSKNYIIPGLIAVILMMIAAMLSSLSIAREWENGTMEELLSTPLRPAELVLGKLSAFFVLGAADTVTAVLAGVFVFEAPLRGSVLLLAASAFVFLFGALCWGLWLSAITRNQLQAYQLGLMSSFLPAFLLSGFVYSIDGMPLIPRLLSRIVPARYFVALLKGIFLKGTGLETLWGEMALLVLYAAVVFVLITRKLGRKIA